MQMWLALLLLAGQAAAQPLWGQQTAWDGLDSYSTAQSGVCLATRNPGVGFSTTATNSLSYAVTARTTCDASVFNGEPNFEWKANSIFTVFDETSYLDQDNLDAATTASAHPWRGRVLVGPEGTLGGVSAVSSVGASASSASHMAQQTWVSTMFGKSGVASTSFGTPGYSGLTGWNVEATVAMSMDLASMAHTPTGLGTFALPSLTTDSALDGVVQWVPTALAAAPNATNHDDVVACVTGVTRTADGAAPVCNAGSALAKGQLKHSIFAFIGGGSQYVQAVTETFIQARADVTAAISATNPVSATKYMVVRNELNMFNLAGATVTFNEGLSLASLGTADVKKITVAFNGQAVVTEFAPTYVVGSAEFSASGSVAQPAKTSPTAVGDFTMDTARSYSRAIKVKASHKNAGLGLAYYVDFLFEVATTSAGDDGLLSDQRFVAYDPTTTYYSSWPLASAGAAGAEADGRALCVIARYVTMACLNLLAAFAVVGVVFTWCYFSPCEWWCHPDLEEGVWDWNVKERKAPPAPEPKKKQPKIKHIVYESETDEEVIEATRIEHVEVADDEELVVLKKNGQVVSDSRSVDPELFASINDTVKTVDPALA
jgi:hypothetical protein